MTILGDNIRAVKSVLDATATDLAARAVALDGYAAEADALSGGEPPPPSGSLTWPTGVNCIGGTQPSAPSLSIAGEGDSGAVVQVYYDRLMDGMPDGAIPFLGHSLVQGMSVCAASPFGINLGYGGESMRRLIGRMLRTNYKSAMERAGAVVVHSGIVDLNNTSYYGPITNLTAANTVIGMYETRLKPWMTGKWLIVGLVHRDGRVSGAPAGFNAACDHVNAALGTMFSSMSNVRVVDANPAMCDSTGNLDPANHTDGLHFSRAGNAILASVIKSGLEDLGVGG
jgi:hypothetical protein